jgi:hypothetical protein
MYPIKKQGFVILLSVIISQKSENKLKIIRQIFELILPDANKFEKESGELFSIYSHSRGVFAGLFFHEYKIKNAKKNIYYRTESFFVHVQQLMTLTVKLKNTLALKKN